LRRDQSFFVNDFSGWLAVEEHKYPAIWFRAEGCMTMEQRVDQRWHSCSRIAIVISVKPALV